MRLTAQPREREFKAWAYFFARQGEVKPLYLFGHLALTVNKCAFRFRVNEPCQSHAVCHPCFGQKMSVDTAHAKILHKYR
jgi:hypothetical protein